MNGIRLLANEHCATGENPYWDAQRQCLYWTDIPAGKLFRHDLATNSHRQIYSGPPVGGFTLQKNGDLLLFRVEDIAVMNEAGDVRTVIAYTDPGMKRFNDVIADPRGRVFAGTIGATNLSGGLYLVELDGSMRQLFDGTGVANGMDFTPDLQHFYWTCSTTKRIYRFRYDIETAELTERELFYEATEEEGIPDGLTVDKTGTIWSARWGGQAVAVISPEGEMIGTVELPVEDVSSVCFAGPNLDQLFVTTAGGKAGAETEDGAVFLLDVEAQGREEFRSAILC